MKTITGLPLVLLSGQALGLLSCTVVAPTLTKRLCEADSCQAYDTIAAGSILHAACRADCSTDDDPWLKLYDGTFVRAHSAAVAGCRYSCQPYAVLGLPRCHEQAGAAKPASCTAAALKPAHPVPQAAEPIVARCNQTLAVSTPQRRVVRSRVFAPRYINGTFSAGPVVNTTGTHIQARSEIVNATQTINSTSTEHASPDVVRRAPFPMLNATAHVNATLAARGVTNTTLNVVTARAHGAVLPRDLSVLNGTVAGVHGLHVRNETAPASAGPKRFVNGTFSGSAGRTPPVVRRIPQLL
ncbi:hypothetical protein QBC47DRAFT_125866 [Echria macrotheca]|uniref:Secreted protein n=1 Tax=Echria macrotheca TaxID=438768 RepID=A0AAJ0B3L7_9PEZI|nr:hypothetical protein QBC47DRAFT_125866 [Echria macrotheca]